MKVGRIWRLGGLAGDDIGEDIGEDSMGLGSGYALDCTLFRVLSRKSSGVGGLLVRRWVLC